MERQSDDLKWHACQLEYLNAVLAKGDTAALMTALAAVARAKRMSRVADEAGLGRLSLYKVLSGSGNPTFATVVGIAAELGYSFSMRAAADSTT
jgi:probable addiction module antidote protein